MHDTDREVYTYTTPGGHDVVVDAHRTLWDEEGKLELGLDGLVGARIAQRLEGEIETLEGELRRLREAMRGLEEEGHRRRDVVHALELELDTALRRVKHHEETLGEANRQRAEVIDLARGRLEGIERPVTGGETSEGRAGRLNSAIATLEEIIAKLGGGTS